MRIAFISYDFGEYCIQHANGLLASGDVLLVMPTELLDPHKEMLSKDVEIRAFSKPRLRQPIRQIRVLRWIFKQLEEFKPDVVHFQLGHLWFNFVLPILRRRYPIVFTVHDPRQHLGDRGAKNTPQWIMDFGYRRADKVIVHGAQLKEVLTEELRISPSDIFVIPHIAIGERNIKSAAPDENSILFFGRIWPYKGLEYLIKAQPLVNQKFPLATFLICGKGEEMDRYYNLMQDPDRFEVTNRWISDEERSAAFERANVVVLPYVEATQSGVVPIAYAHSKPVIATRTGGLPDVIDHGQTGLLVEPKDEVGLANAIIKLLKDNELCNSMGAAGYQKLQSELSPEVVCQQTVEVYQSAIDGRTITEHRNHTELSNSGQVEILPANSLMTPETENRNKKYLRSATLLHQYLVDAHWNGTSLPGPDPGIRFNTRVGRFVKSYLSILPWSDNLTYMQGQGYWVFNNWQLFELTGDEEAKSIALSCSDIIVEMQRPVGYWEYPNPEWKDRIATVEGCFAALGLLDSFSHFSDEKYLDAARRWFDYLVSEIGFRQQQQTNMWAINYFAHRRGNGGGVPNNSTLLLWFLARLNQLTGESKYLEPCEKTVNWLNHVQLPSGELPYALGRTAEKDKTHFLCFQYNAFEFMDLVNYHRITGDSDIWPVIERLAKYLATGLTNEGKARFDCLHDTPDVPYYTIAIARALSLATDLKLGEYRAKSDQAFRQVLSHQRSDGSFHYHSRQNYGCLTDRRSYPRYLSMILHHLLLECQSRQSTTEPAQQIQA